MRRVLGPVVVVGALFLGSWGAEVAVFGTPAAKHTPSGIADDGDNQHPSGKDRSVEPGGSGTQGKSPSDPDGTTNGGPDKPGGPGGVDGDDQDGNNGCGNDDDFEDDNNGRCLGRARSTYPAPPAPIINP